MRILTLCAAALMLGGCQLLQESLQQLRTLQQTCAAAQASYDSSLPHRLHL